MSIGMPCFTLIDILSSAIDTTFAQLFVYLFVLVLHQTTPFVHQNLFTTIFSSSATSAYITPAKAHKTMVHVITRSNLKT